MKSIFFTLIFICSLSITSQNMTSSKLNEIYSTMSDSIVVSSRGSQFFINKVPLIAITDSNNNRMRIISPITDSKSLDSDLIKACLIANFHTALDVKYAVTDGVLWSVYVHPLKELTEDQVKDAVTQVYNANITFGTSFSSTNLSFPASNTSNSNSSNPPKILKKQI